MRVDKYRVAPSTIKTSLIIVFDFKTTFKNAIAYYYRSDPVYKIRYESGSRGHIDYITGSVRPSLDFVDTSL